jgi:hypothetical protein
LRYYQENSNQGKKKGADGGIWGRKIKANCFRTSAKQQNGDRFTYAWTVVSSRGRFFILRESMKSTKGIFLMSVLVLIVTVLSLGVESSRAQEVIWQNDWTVPQYLTLGLGGYASDGTNVAFSPDGEILLGAPSATLWDDHFERVESNGTLRWSRNVGGGFGSSYGAAMGLIANADGSAEVLASSGSAVVKINPDGSIAWLHPTSLASALVKVPTQSIALTDCNSISLIDTDTGQTVWLYQISQLTNSCPSPIAVADSSGNVYVGYASYDPTTKLLDGYRSLELDTSGNKVWDVLVSASFAVQPFGVGSGLVYLNQNACNGSVCAAPAVVALQSTNGNQAWNVSGSGIGIVTSAGAPIVMNGSQIERLSATTGQPSWSQNSPVTINTSSSVASVIGSDILVGWYGSPPSGLARLDAGTGALIWSATVPQVDSYGDELETIAVGEIAGPTVIAVLRPFSLTAPPVLEELDFTTGQLLGQIPLVPTAQGVSGNSMLVGSNNIAAATVVSTPNGGQLRVRMLAASTGAPEWETADTSTPVAASPVWPIGVAAGGSVVAATVDSSYWSGYSAIGVGNMQIDAFDAASGAKTWSKTLSNPSLGFAYLLGPMVDTSGNVFVPYGATTYCDYAHEDVCGVQSLLKLAAADGSTSWEFDNGLGFVGFGNGQVFPQTAALQGTDVLVGGPFSGPYSTATMLRLSGVDGSVQWSATVPTMTDNSVWSIFPGMNSIIIVGSGWAGIDAATGQVLWANSPNSSDSGTCATPPCYTYASLRMASDDILVGGENGGHAIVTLMPAGQGGQAKNFSFYSETSTFRSLVDQIVQDSANRIWLEIHRHYRGGNNGHTGINLLAQFDPASGQLLSGQVISPFDDSVVATSMQPLLLGPPENYQASVQTWPLQAGMPDTTGNALISTTITATGDLALIAAVDELASSVGQTLTFHFTATYSGDAPISGAHLLADLPWSSTPTNITCATQSASNCIVNVNSEAVSASFEMQSGGQVSISGQIAVDSIGGATMLQGVVYGPTGLNELNTTNNFGYLYVSAEIFKNGFE